MNYRSPVTRSIEQITDSASSFDYSPAVPLRKWLVAARQLRSQGKIYEQEGSYENAYELYYRQAILVLKHLSTHPEVRESAKGRALLGAASKDVDITLRDLERIKPFVEEAWQRYLKQQEAELRAAQRRADEKLARSRPSSSNTFGRLSNEFDLHFPQYKEVSGEHDQDFALEVARRNQRPPQSLRTGSAQPEDGSKLSQRMQGIRLHLDGKQPTAQRSKLPYPAERTPSSSSLAYKSYPSVPTKSRPVPLEEPSIPLNIPKPPSSPQRAPTVPRKEPFQATQVPARPPKELLQTASTLSSSETAVSPPPFPAKSAAPYPAPAEAPKFKPAAYLENGTPLRTVFFPPQMRIDFLRLAQANTSRNLETCGILCGVLRSNALFIQKLVVPEQISTSDTCEVTDEGEIALFDYVDGQDMLTLGWIHTHPTQTCFMSSRDLHTHCGYQAMIPESIAIVCAPSLGEWGVFRLTDPPGMKTIQTCSKPGIFHPHDVDDIYTDAKRPGHVVELEGSPYSIHDMRGKA